MLEALGGQGDAGLPSSSLHCPVRLALEALEERVVPAYWIGPPSGDFLFGTAANWSDGIVPGDPGSNGYAEFFPNPGTNTPCIVNGVFNVDRVTMSAGYTATLFVPTGSSLTATTLFDQHGGLVLDGGGVASGNHFYVNGPVAASPSVVGPFFSAIVAGAGLHLNGAIAVTGGSDTVPGLVLDSDDIDAANDITVGINDGATTGVLRIVGSLEVLASSDIIVYGSLYSFNGLLYEGTTAGSFFHMKGTLTLLGATVAIAAGDELEVRDGGVLTSLALTGGQDVIVGDVQVGPNSGTLNVGSAAGATSELQFNTGSLEVQGTGTVNLYASSVLNFPAAVGVTSTVTIAGTLNMYTATLIAAPSRVAAVEVTGVLVSATATGSIIYGNVVNNGRIECGGAVHALGIAAVGGVGGNYTQGNEGELVIRLDNASFVNDVIAIDGAATLDGTLTLEAINPLTAGQTWTIMFTGLGIVGDFDTVNLPDGNPAWDTAIINLGLDYQVTN
ncbi:MAG: hypothetical protein L0Z62_26200 [Gemmataceae bacterium]|nr:hypothetical protein [Gemmataceae bacterium]